MIVRLKQLLRSNASGFTIYDTRLGGDSELSA